MPRMSSIGETTTFLLSLVAFLVKGWRNDRLRIAYPSGFITTYHIGLTSIGVDVNRCEVTCGAAEVLASQTVFCYAKSPLVAVRMRIHALTRDSITSVTGDGPPYCLHGLDAVLLKNHGWYRIDVGGDTGAVHADFSTPREELGFRVTSAGEVAPPEIWPDPHPSIVTALRTATSVE